MARKPASRTRLSLEALSVAGSSGAYEYHGLTASAEQVNVSVDSPRFSGLPLEAAVKAQLPAGAIVVVCDYDAGLANPSLTGISESVAQMISPPLQAAIQADAAVAGVAENAGKH